MKLIVGIGDMKISSRPGDILVTHALGSCLGVVVHDPCSKVAGLLHVMLPLSKINPEKAQANPCMFVDTGVPAFFREVYAAGGAKSRLIVKVAGGAEVSDNTNGGFEIGRRNYVVLRKIFWKNGILIDAEDVGGRCPRTLSMQVDTGRVWLSVDGMRREL